jgi:hypothetical protein
LRGLGPATYDSSMKTDLEFISHHPPQALKPFAEPSTDRGLKILFSVGRSRDALEFNFVLTGRVPAEIEKLVLPDLSEPPMRKRRDELWKNTCFEIFIGSANSQSYFELNLAPSGDWNVYAFDNYRAGMRPVGDAHAPLLKFYRTQAGDLLTWHARLASTDMHGEVGQLLNSGALVMGASCVLEYAKGDREYWALAHAGPKPDFHLRESFRLPL